MFTKTKKNLVVLPYGNTSLHSDWIFDEAGRDFDVILLIYHDEIANPLLAQATSSFSIRHLKSFKWWMIQQLFTDEPGLLDQYEQFFFPDDDIVISLEDANFLFHITKMLNLDLAQPGLSRSSYKSWRVLRRKLASGFRYLSAVELMCPVMSARAVRKLLPTFALNKSGWGIDILWGELIREEFGEKSIAVIDIIVVDHIKPVGKGELYVKLGTPAPQERDEVFRKFNITVTKIYKLSMAENGLLQRLSNYRRLRKLKREMTV